MVQRCLAFTMDTVLALALAIMMLKYFLLPTFFPIGYGQLLEAFDEYIEAVEQAEREGKPPPPAPEIQDDEDIVSALQFAYNVIAISYWAYFFLSTLMLRGSTLGKRTFGLLVVNRVDNHPPPVFTLIARAGMQAFTFVAIAPILWVNYLIAFFTLGKRAGHDKLSGTRVVTANPRTK